MGKTILFVVPDSIGLEVQAEKVFSLDAVLVGICIFIPSTAYGPANHADPVVFLLTAFRTDSLPF